MKNARQLLDTECDSLRLVINDVVKELDAHRCRFDQAMLVLCVVQHGLMHEQIELASATGNADLFNLAKDLVEAQNELAGRVNGLVVAMARRRGQ